MSFTVIVDCTVEKELGSRFEIKGFPTLKIFRRGEPSPYGGPRDKQGIIDYMLKVEARVLLMIE